MIWEKFIEIHGGSGDPPLPLPGGAHGAWVLAWLSVCKGVDCLHMGQLMPLPLIVSCCSKIQIGFTFLVPAHPGSPGKRAKWCVSTASAHIIAENLNATRAFMH